MSTKPRDVQLSGAGSLLFGKTRGRLLAWLFSHPDERFYLRQLVRETGSAQGGVQRELQLLAAAGLIQRTLEGRQVYFQANADSPLFPELQSLLLKTFGAVQIIREALVASKLPIVLAFIYGSAARGTVRASSDVDLLVVTAASMTEIVSALAPAQRLLKREINPSIYPDEEFKRKIDTGHHFLSSVLHQPKVFVIGDQHELERLVEVRMGNKTRDKRARNRRPPRRSGP